MNIIENTQSHKSKPLEINKISNGGLKMVNLQHKNNLCEVLADKEASNGAFKSQYLVFFLVLGAHIEATPVVSSSSFRASSGNPSSLCRNRCDDMLGKRLLLCQQARMREKKPKMV